MPPTADSNGQADTATPAPPREDVLAQAALLQQLMAEACFSSPFL